MKIHLTEQTHSTGVIRYCDNKESEGDIIATKHILRTSVGILCDSRDLVTCSDCVTKMDKELERVAILSNN